METPDQLKELVRQKYGEIARQEQDSCCTSSCCGTSDAKVEVYNIMSESYEQLEGYNPDADMGLGCGLPTQFARISKGDTVLDLGSGAGNDCFVARAETGETGRVIGIDFTPDMVNRARENAHKLGFSNVEFIFGDIEEMPLPDATANVVVSNCVLNLVPNKQRAFSEVFRVLKPGGHFSISDIVLKGELPEKLKTAAEFYAGCVSGAIQKEAYLGLVQDAGFEDLQIQKEKEIHVPDSFLLEYLTPEELYMLRSGSAGVFSITLFGRKPF
ncbi:MAG: arsenite methyltransferase [Saprospirales bacterium]|nr:arsenite methyltransferase [Saprospirales bacterium]